MTDAIIDPPRTHNQVSIEQILEFIKADLKERAEPFLQEWHGGDGKTGLSAIWEIYEKDRVFLIDEDQVAKCTEFAKKLDGKFGLIKTLDGLRGPAAEPLKSATNEINNIIATYLAPIIKARDGLRERLQAYADRQLAEKQKRETEATENAARLAKMGPTGIQQAAAVLSSAAKPIESIKSERGASMETRVGYKYKGVSDISLVPLQYLMVDEAAVRKAISKVGGVTAIAGLIIEQEANVVLK